MSSNLSSSAFYKKIVALDDAREAGIAETNRRLSPDDQLKEDATFQDIFAKIEGIGKTNVAPTLEVDPTTTEQFLRPENGYHFDEVRVGAVTSEIDANIQAENILEGKTILGVAGTAVEYKAPTVSGGKLVFQKHASVEGNKLKLD